MAVGFPPSGYLGMVWMAMQAQTGSLPRGTFARHVAGEIAQAPDQGTIVRADHHGDEAAKSSILTETGVCMRY
ncbi:hypothetical protein CCMA1212_010028 [Trichoderma ghanense]|uniref:Uncharacterized protein n=1 Tax=Trichoderma ghanense TaxID=65468 RepID=A0ABY2GRH1_9HYPO